MGCKFTTVQEESENNESVTPRRQRRRPRSLLPIFDTGYLPSSESETDTPTPTQKKEIVLVESFPNKKNAMKCYICFEKTGLLIKMPRCRCDFYAHKSCLINYVNNYRVKCSICKEFFCLPENKETKRELVLKIMTVIKDREELYKKKVFIESIISVT